MGGLTGHCVSDTPLLIGGSKSHLLGLAESEPQVGLDAISRFFPLPTGVRVT